ncbi:hypothetical protein [Sphingobium chungbukense]|uniref:Acyl-CoA transferase n=1 Tax=Sphingobium chungbukense TaxID=56193 RepID=A0A0M3ATI8_9SPHN|nr:hypothetical protein [Sphingobium chungbukense]KKW92251.1 hypothetical protein YP76_09970 [Sphingobium chungbukense]
MSHRLQVLAAVKAVIANALPTCEIVGLTNEADRPLRISPLDTIVIRDGDPGEPAIDLSPPAYHFDHSIPVELMTLASPNVDMRERLDQRAGAIGAGIASDPFLAGLCTFIDVTALEIVDAVVPGGASQLVGQFEIIASYSTSSPLG